MKPPLAEYKRVLSALLIVCVDCLVLNDKGEFLLVKGKNEPLKGEYWIPGGRIYKNERLVDAVHRKMREEIGVEVEIVRKLGFFEEFFDKTVEGSKEACTRSASFIWSGHPATTSSSTTKARNGPGSRICRIVSRNIPMSRIGMKIQNAM
jgi:hypothetical protein